MNETTINDIDLSKYFKNHYDSWGRLYCVEYKGNPLELQNAIKRLQEENEELKKQIKKQKNAKIQLKNLDSRFAEDYCNIKEENKKLKEKIHFKSLYKLSGKCFFDEARECNYFDDFVKARQALEEIKNEANRLLYEENPIYGYNDSNYFEILAKYVLAKTKEVLK